MRLVHRKEHLDAADATMRLPGPSPHARATANERPDASDILSGYCAATVYSLSTATGLQPTYPDLTELSSA